MNITQSSSAHSSAPIPPERLLEAKNLSEGEKIEELSRQFEAVLLRKILSEAHKPLLGNAIMGDSSSTAIYQDIMIAQLADQISTAQSLGLANALKQQLGNKNADLDSGNVKIGPENNQ